MNTINRIKKITEAHDHIDQAINLILGAVSGFPEEEQIKDKIVDPLLKIIDPSRNLDLTNIQDLLAFILNGERRKIYLIIDGSEKIAFSTKEEADLYINQYAPDVELIEIGLR